MTQEEVGKILSVIKRIYANQYRNMQIKESKDILLLWSNIFADYEFNSVLAAVNYFIKMDTKGFAPLPGQLIEIIAKKTVDSVHLVDAGTAWEMLWEIARQNGFKNYKTIFSKLPPIIQKTAICPSTIVSWANADGNEFDKYIKADFFKNYKKNQSEYLELCKTNDKQGLARYLNSPINLLIADNAKVEKIEKKHNLQDCEIVEITLKDEEIEEAKIYLAELRGEI